MSQLATCHLCGGSEFYWKLRAAQITVGPLRQWQSELCPECTELLHESVSLALKSLRHRHDSPAPSVAVPEVVNGPQTCMATDSGFGWHCSLPLSHNGPHRAFVAHNLSGELLVEWPTPEAR